MQTAKKTSKKNAAKVYKVDAKRVREWRQQEEKLRAVTNDRSTKRLPGAGRPFKCESLEEALSEWVADRRARSLQVSRKMIQWKAKELFQKTPTDEKQDLNFSASDGWLSGFMKRNHLSLRRRTTVA